MIAFAAAAPVTTASLPAAAQTQPFAALVAGRQAAPAPGGVARGGVALGGLVPA